MPTVLELQERRASGWERMKALVEGAEAGDRDLNAEERQNWDAANAEVETLDVRIENQRRLESTPAPGQQGRSDPGESRVLPAPRATATPEYRRAFDSYLRAGVLSLEPEERSCLRSGFSVLTPAETRALGVASVVAGGYLVPEDSSLMGRVERALLWFGGMREVATVLRTTSGADLPIPTGNDTGNTGRLLNENTAATETDATFGAVILKAFMYSSDMIRVSLQLLQDAEIDVEAYLGEILGERIGRILNTHFTLGVGVNEPRGIALDTVEGRAGAAGQTTTVTWDDLIFLEHAVDIAYRRRPGVRYMMRDATVRDIRRLKDGNGQFLWQPGVGQGAPNTINGFGYVVNNDVAAMAASARSIYFGDLSRYHIRDVMGLRVLRLEERYAEFGQVAFLGFSRHDGALVNAGGSPVQHYANPAA